MEHDYSLPGAILSQPWEPEWTIGVMPVATIKPERTRVPEPILKAERAYVNARNLGIKRYNDAVLSARRNREQYLHFGVKLPDWELHAYLPEPAEYQ